MRSRRILLPAALALTLGAASANASSVNIIWQTSNAPTTTVAAHSLVVGNIVISIGASDTAVDGNCLIELSADTSNADLAILDASQIVVSDFVDFPTGPSGYSHYENVIAQGGLSASVVGLQPGTSTVIGTITVHAVSSGSVVVSNSGPSDVIMDETGSLVSEFTFGAGEIHVVSEPATAGLMSLGLLGLGVVGRRRSRWPGRRWGREDQAAGPPSAL